MQKGSDLLETVFHIGSLGKGKGDFGSGSLHIQIVLGHGEGQESHSLVDEGIGTADDSHDLELYGLHSTVSGAGSDLYRVPDLCSQVIGQPVPDQNLAFPASKIAAPLDESLFEPEYLAVGVRIDSHHFDRE